MRACCGSIAAVALSFAMLAACSEDEDDAPGGGSSGTSGASGSAGSAGTAGASGRGGASGSGGSSGSAGASGSGGSAGSGGATGSGGTAGTAGTGTGGAAGDGGPGGSAGSDGGMDGAVSSQMSFFITSTGSGAEGGNLGGLAGADAKCQSLAMAVGLGNKTWRAYLSVTGGDGGPNDNARTRIGSGPWFNAAGVKIADTVAQLHEEGATTNNLNAQTGLDERGQPVPGRDNRPDGSGLMNQHDILTGSSADGRAATGSPAPNCANWTSNASSGQVAQVGHFDRVGGGASPMSWNSAHTTPGCSETQLRNVGGAGRVYCFATN